MPRRSSPSTADRGRHEARPPPPGDTLFTAAAKRDPARTGAVPLAERMRPTTLADFVGQAHLFGAEQAPRARDRRRPGPVDDPLGPARRRQDDARRASSPQQTNAPLRPLQRRARQRRRAARDRRRGARSALAYEGKRTIVFVDEIHRFNKAQQDAFLPHVEDGTITLIGATTENPSFAVNAALLSRCKVFRLEPLGEDELVRAPRARARRRGARPRRAHLARRRRRARRHRRARRGATRGARSRRSRSPPTTCERAGETRASRSTRVARARTSRRPLLYDKAGEEHYNVVSAFIKSMRGSDPDAAVYWMMRMLEAGDDPLFVLRRMLIFASEDVGNADPRALDGRGRGGRRPSAAWGCPRASTRSRTPASTWRPRRNRTRERGLASREGARRRARRAAGAEEAPQRGDDADEGRGLRRRATSTRTTSRAAVVPGETYLPDELAGERPLRADRARRRGARSRQRLDELRAEGAQALT